MSPRRDRTARPRSLHAWFVYASLACLLIYLARRGLLETPDVRSPAALTASAGFLLAGFLCGAVAWQRILHSSGIASGLGECVASTGLSVFGKYIPGKIWLALGRAAYVAERQRRPLSTLSVLSVNEQLLAWWAGLVFGAVGLLWAGPLQAYGWLVLALWIALSLVIFTPWLHRAAEVALRRLLRQPWRLPALDPSALRAVLPWSAATWLAWSVGFYLLASALTATRVPPAAALVFPLAGTLGAMALLAPGGLGIREGVLSACLSLLGVPAVEAVSISVASRLWFLFGEAACFAVGWLARSRAL